MKKSDQAIGLLVVGFVILFVSAWVVMIVFYSHPDIQPVATFAPKNLINQSIPP